jgi:hypothetical protein
VAGRGRTASPCPEGISRAARQSWYREEGWKVSGEENYRGARRRNDDDFEAEWFRGNVNGGELGRVGNLARNL